MKQRTTIFINSKLYLKFLRELQETAAQFRSRITIQRGDSAADAKSFVEVLYLIEGKGKRLEVTADGEDSPMALATVIQLAEKNFLKIRSRNLQPKDHRRNGESRWIFWKTGRWKKDFLRGVYPNEV